MRNFEMTMNLNVLHHLGINLYSNIPAVLSEIVANAWDADADNVYIILEEDKIIIEDTGIGMNRNDLIDKYLKVGYQKRETDFSVTPNFLRPVMGRKGIGKLSLFSIARCITIFSQKNGEKNGLRILVDDLEEKIKTGEQKYFPDELSDVDIVHDGTKIVLSDLKRKTFNTQSFLKKRLARRFSVLGEEHNFNVYINDEKISVLDRAYFHKIQQIWSYIIDTSDDPNCKIDYKKFCKEEKVVYHTVRPSLIPETNYNIHGWIGSVENSGDLKDEEDNLNKIVIMVRGKLAQEDILEDFNEGGLYSKYLIGEIHADFLDFDEEPDIATSSRQKIIEDDPRYKSLKDFIQSELKYIQRQWSDIRREKGKEEALKIPAIKEWFKELKGDHKKKAESLFGKINQLTLETDAKKDLFKHSVLAFESFRHKELLDDFDKISPENIEVFGALMANYDDIEATLYHQIINERLKVIKALQDKVDDNALEKVLQKHLYDHLWLLDPSWDRATETPVMEQNMAKEFNKIAAGLTDEEKKARYDIKYKKTSGKHIIIELKRADIVTDTYALTKQVNKYYDALKKLLRETKKDRELIEIICIVGRPLSDWTDESSIERSTKMLMSCHARVVMYKQLIEDAQRSYQQFLEQNKNAGRVSRLLEEIDKTYN